MPLMNLPVVYGSHANIGIDRRSAFKGLDYLLQCRATVNEEWLTTAAFSFEDQANRYAWAMKTSFPDSTILYRIVSLVTPANDRLRRQRLR